MGGDWSCKMMLGGDSVKLTRLEQRAGSGLWLELSLPLVSLTPIWLLAKWPDSVK